MPPLGKFAIFLSVLLLLSGAVAAVIYNDLPLGNLPGDITIDKQDFKFYLPFTTSVAISGALSALALLLVMIF